MLILKKLAVVISQIIFVANMVYADTASRRMALPSPGLSLLTQAKLIGPVNTKKKIQFTVWLKLRNKAELDQFVRDAYNPQSSQYHHFLMHEQFQANYAPSQESLNLIQNYFASNGMDARIEKNNSVRITATIEQIKRIFNVQMNTYHFHGRTVIANATALSLSPDIAQYISEVSGLNTMIRFMPNNHRMPNHAKKINAKDPQDLHFLWDSFVLTAQPTTTSIGGITGANLVTAYNVANIPNVGGTVINGAGQTMVIIDQCGENSATTIQSDANQFNTANALTQFSAANFTVLNQSLTPFTTCDVSGETGWESEIGLDVESSHTIAQGANTVLVLANDATSADLETTVANVITQLTSNNFTIGGFSNAYVVSNSWGLPEFTGEFPSMEANLEIAAAHGISFNYSSGDCGDNTYTSSAGCPRDSSTLSVQYPSSSNYVTAVGGTSLFVNNSYAYAFESGWGSYINGGYYFGAGGGISANYPAPSWQSSISGFTAGGYNAGTVGQYNMRAIPDVAMVADPYTGLYIYVTGTASPFAEGGTSLSCPLFSGTLTLVNQARALLNGGVANPIGQAAPTLYTRNSTLLNNQAIKLVVPPHQIISGASRGPVGSPSSAFTISGITYSWDSSLSIIEDQFWNDVVGVGSPNIPNFVTLLATL